MQKRTQEKSDALYPARVTSAAQFEALASPVRDQIAQVVVNQAPWSPDNPDVEGVSIREIAEQLGRQPGSLYRHIDELLEAGLIREVGSQLSGGRDATTYAAPGELLFLVTPDRAGPQMDAMCRYINRMAKHAGWESAQATRDRAKRTPPGEHPDDFTVSMFGWLDEQQRAKLRELMHELAGIFDYADRRPDTRLIAASLLVRPVRLPNGETAQTAKDNPDLAPREHMT
jgi:DNA-binding Lrp family transcriptional regulator